MKNNRKIEVGQVRDWVGLDGETCVILSLTDTQVEVRYLKSDEGENNYKYPINRFMEKTIVVM
ncbi:hypothetical protein VPIG_00013 [Vibrio phage PWH3a-P1]|uniref:hypothetical protein n=1 Tax=Vibrio phage PWH3a-P1 TaxID=754058 RepID=UPI0002C0F088|nr:hypothetical protein VPIG_00013 [Vibrio phage PWH3a-P1]AGH31871.1 hypothetical protein VPIG_00013 [Vibrio phage PWH3a-P1]